MAEATVAEREASRSGVRPAQPEKRDYPLDATGVAVSLLCSAFWAGNTIAIKICVPAIPAFACAGLRFFLVLPFIWAVCRFSGQPLRTPRGWLAALLCSAFLNFLQIGTFTLGTSLTHAGRASVLINVHPLVVVPLSCWLLGEPVRWRTALGAVVAVVGVAVMFVESWAAVEGLLLGDFIVLTSGLTLGVYIVLQKLWLRRIPQYTFLFWSLALSVPFFGIVAWALEPRDYRIDMSVAAALAYQVLVVSGVAFSLWIWLLSRYPAGPLAVLGLCTPVFGVLFGWLLRGEPLTVWLLLGCALLVFGLYLVVQPSEAHSFDR